MSVKNTRVILKACAEDTRLRILNLLGNNEITVKMISQVLKVNQSVISKHLGRLRLLKIVFDRRDGNLVYYRLTQNKDSFQYKLINFLRKHCAEIPACKEDKKLLSKLKQ